MHDVRVLDLHGPVLSELVQDCLGHLLGCPVLGAQRPIVERHRPSHLFVAAVVFETPYRGHGSAALHAALRNFEDGLDYAEGTQVPEDTVGSGLGEPKLYLEEPPRRGAVPAEVEEGLGYGVLPEDTATR